MKNLRGDHPISDDLFRTLQFSLSRDDYNTIVKYVFEAEAERRQLIITTTLYEASRNQVDEMMEGVRIATETVKHIREKLNCIKI